jgi:alkylation response protein AidB-like acyl-CoA dehydrogenase
MSQAQSNNAMAIDEAAFAALCAEAAREAEATEQARQLSPELARRIANIGLFSMFVPKQIGGGEMTPPAGLEKIERLARHDAAAAWVVMIGSTAALGAAYIAPDIGVDMFAAQDRITCGIFAPNGVAVRHGDIYRVSGRWAWASGSANADYIGLGCVAKETDDPEERGTVRLLMVPREALIFHDTWHTIGLCGTSSGDVEVRDIEVPVAHSYSIATDTPWPDAPLYNMPYFGFLATGVAAVALGNARAALDEFIALAGAKKGQGQKRILAEKSAVQAGLAEAEAQWRAARALFVTTISDIWEDVQGGGAMTPEKRADLRLVSTHAVRHCVHVVRAVHDLAGGTSVYRTSPIQRRLRDAETMTQHMITNADTLALVGRVMLGGWHAKMQL